MRKLIYLTPALALLAACGTTPRSIVQTPMVIRPAAVAKPAPVSGAIYQAGQGRSLFEDRLARNVGDTLTIDISETLSATNKAGNKAERTGSVAVSATGFAAPYTPGAIEKLAGVNIGATGSNKHDGKGETSTSNTFTGTITATVIEVLPNNNLVVSGEKQIAINGEVTHLRFSGVVTPADIKPGNSVSSTKIAEARIEQVGSGAIADATDMPWLQRLAMKLSPF